MKALLLTVFVLSSSVNAMEQAIRFHGENNYYHLKISPQKVQFSGHLLELSFKQRDCNQTLIESLNQNLKDAFKTIVINPKSYFLVQRDQESLKIDKNSSLARYLFNLPNELKKLKSQESFLCR